MQSTLLLAASYEPIDIISWQEAVRLITLDKAEVIEEYEDELHSTYLIIKMPAVIRLLNLFRKRKKKVKFSRVNIYSRDKFSCFSGDTLILLANGSQIPIKEVYQGLEVIDAYGKPTKVVACGSRVVDNAIDIKYKGSFEKTVTTPEHPYLNEDNKFIPIGDKPNFLVSPRKIQYILRDPISLSVADFLPEEKWFRLKNGRIYSTRRPHEHGFPALIKQTKTLAYIAGLYVGDGCSVLPQGRITWSFNKGQKETLAKDVEYFLDSLGLYHSTYGKKGNEILSVGTNSKIFSYFLRACCGYGGSDNKKTPWNLIGPFHSDYLRGLFLSDGYISEENKRIVLSMTSYDVVLSARSLLWGFSIFPTLQTGSRLNRKTTWSIVLQGENYSKFMNIILGNHVGPGKKIYGNEEFTFHRLESIKAHSNIIEVFNIETESHSYIANGVSVHNCQYCGKKGKMNDFTFDHVLPRAQGGKTTWENIVTCCPECNCKKDNRTPQQAKMKLLSIPVQPQWLPAVTIRLSRKSIPEMWRDYLYWNIGLEE